MSRGTAGDTAGSSTHAHGISTSTCCSSFRSDDPVKISRLKLHNRSNRTPESDY